jgi:hypothetical protein
MFRIGRILRSKTREEVFTLCDKYDDNSQEPVLPYVYIIREDFERICKSFL